MHRGRSERWSVGFVVFAMAFALAITSASAADWPSFRGGPTQNMTSPEDPGRHPEQIWESIESVRSEPCVIALGESIFTIATPRTDFGLQRLYRVGLDTGKAIWASPTFDATEPQSCPTAEGSRVFYPHRRFLTARNVSDGAQVWETDLGAELGKPVASGGRVYVQSSSKLFALDSSDGTLLWSASVQPSARPPLVVGGVVVAVSYETSGSSLSAFDAATGASLWSASGRPWDAIAVDGRIVYTPGGASVVSRDAKSGAVEWTYSPPALTTPSSLVADKGTVYVLAPTSDTRFQANHLIALDEETGFPHYERKFEMTSGCCGTTAPYRPFTKFGPLLYNQYRYFDAATGQSPGEQSSTQSIFYDGSCANEQDSAFAKAGLKVVVWKSYCSRSVLVGKEGHEGPVAPELMEPAADALTNGHPHFVWRMKNRDDLSEYELLVDGQVFQKFPVGANPEITRAGREEIDLPSGSHTWSAIAIDAFGRRTASETRAFDVDSDPPGEFELLKPEADGHAGRRPSFSWEPAVDAGAGLSHYELIVDNLWVADLPPGTESYALSSELEEGQHSWMVIAVDKVGNSRFVGFQSFSVETAPSPVQLLAPVEDGAVGPRPSFSWQAPSDPGSGIDHYELMLDEAPFAEVSAAGEVVSFTPQKDLQQGLHLWSVRAVDTLGDYSESLSRWIHVDATPPGPITLSAPKDGAVLDARPSFAWEGAPDTDSGIDHFDLIVDGKAHATSSTSTSLPFDLADGSHTWSVASVDAVGNRTESETRGFSVDASPPAPFALLQPAEGAVTKADLSFAWQPAVDVGAAGLARYELAIDGNLAAEVPAGTEAFDAKGLAPGSHVWQVTAVDALGNRRTSDARSFIVASPPQAALAETSILALTGTPVTFDASPSMAPPGGVITAFEWDLDGNGSYEVSTGTTPTVSHAYGRVENVVATVRVRSNLGTAAVASADVSVRPAPPAGPLGVTINGGAQFTNSPAVTVSVVWPIYATTASLANDGGFRAASSTALTAQIPWTLESSGSERLPKTVYVRFGGGTAGRETYQDDIILDQQKPKVGKAALTGGTVLSLGARDRTSGVEAMQIAADGQAAAPWRPFRRHVRLSRPHRGVKVRVRDRAGNVSLWRWARSPGRRR
jgi:outer membrane protein assembly factor BamB